MSASRRPVGRLGSASTRGQSSSELVLLTGLAVVILLAMGITFRGSLIAATGVIANRISCAVWGGGGCGGAAGAAAGAASAPPTRNAYGLVSVGGPTPPGSESTTTSPASLTSPASATSLASPTSLAPTRAGSSAVVLPAPPAGEPAASPTNVGRSGTPSASSVGSLAVGSAAGILGGGPQGLSTGAMGTAGVPWAGTPPSLDALPDAIAGGTTPLDPTRDYKNTVNQEIADYLGQFQGTKFGEAVSIGDPGKFQAASEQNLNGFVVGPVSTSAKASHSSGPFTADILVPFVPGAETDQNKRREQQQTLTHEMTHHIEEQLGVKKRSQPTKAFGVTIRDKDPDSERNTDYQDRVVNELNAWRRHESQVLDRPPRRTPEEAVGIWRNLQENLRDLEAGSATGGYPPDRTLQSMTGFNVSAKAIRDYYMSEACNCPQLKRMVELAEAQEAAEAAGTPTPGAGAAPP